MTQLDAFERRLLAGLRTVVEEDARRPSAPPVAPARHRGPGAVAAAAAAAVGVAAVLVPTLHTEPAWAVSRDGSGTVEVQVNRIEDADGLERELAAVGVTADVTYVRDGHRCAPDRYPPLDTPGLAVSIGSDRSFRVTLPPGTVPADGVLVVAASFVVRPDEQHDDGSGRTGAVRVWVDVGVTTGTVGPCVTVPARD